MQRNAPIGIFDSGVGGLSVFREIRAHLPSERMLYVADSGHAPYGNKPEQFIVRRSLVISDFLLKQGAKALVAACNTATAAAIHELRRRFTVPIIGIEPALKPAVAMTRCGVVGVLATDNTLRSDKFANLMNQHGHRARILVQPCLGLADCVERGDLHGVQTRALLERYLAPLLQAGMDTLVLGCTHYPFLTALLRELIGADISIVDPSPAVARRLRYCLAISDLLAVEDGAPREERYFTSGALEPTATVMQRLLGITLHLEFLPEPFRSTTNFTEDCGAEDRSTGNAFPNRTC